jgi:hypothetical protein
MILPAKKTIIKHDSWIIILMIIWGLCDGKICFQSYADKESLKNLLVAFNCLNLEISRISFPSWLKSQMGLSFDVSDPEINFSSLKSKEERNRIIF